MKKRKFTLWHSLLGTVAFLVMEGLLMRALFAQPEADKFLIFIFALFGALANIYVATEVVEEVRGIRQMLFLLSAVVVEFVVYFAFQYWYLLIIEPTSFPTLPGQPVTLLLHSLMVFVFNPLYLPVSTAGQALLIINTLGGLGLAMFILQNIWQIRRS